MSNTKQKKAVLGIVQGFREPAKEEKITPARKTKTDVTDASQPEQTDEVVRTTSYLPKPLHRRVKIALLNRDHRLGLSNLVVQLLEEWVEKEEGSK